MKEFILILLFVITTSCAGPHGPFGALKIANKKARGLAGLSKNRNQNITIDISPKKQIFHKKYPLKITINDPNGIQEESIFNIYYNGDKVDHWWKSYTSKKVSDTKLVITIPNFRLLAEQRNDIEFIYQRKDNNDFATKKYTTPVCPIQNHLTLQDKLGFDISEDIAQYINTEGKKHHINPSLLAGLIAQESSFNPKAVSYAKAIGLTQVTNRASYHVTLNFKGWPVYPYVEKMSYLKLKYLISSNKIDEQQDWRLNRKKSILGGIEYLRYLDNYWSLRSHESLLNRSFHKVPRTQIILASYNSGPYRVKKAIQKMGPKWLTDNSLNAARYYVNNIQSYCYDFSTQKKTGSL